MRHEAQLETDPRRQHEPCEQPTLSYTDMKDKGQHLARGERLSRRAFLTTSAGATVAIAGCLGDDDSDEADSAPTETPTPPGGQLGSSPSLPRVENPPEAVYLPTHRNPMQMLPSVDAGEYSVSPMLSYPHKFWLITGTEREVVNPERSGVHLMMTIVDAETGTVLPIDKGPTARVKRDGQLIDQRAPWPMISQNMGFHFGDNVGLPEPGAYTVEFDINPLTNVRKTRGFEGRFENRQTVTFEFDYDRELQRKLNEVSYFEESRWGEKDALSPMGMGGMGGGMSGDNGDMGGGNGNGDMGGGMGGMSMPYSQLPEPSSYPGTAVGTASSGDATFVVRYLDETELTDGTTGYLLVSPRTPYNRVPLPAMALSASGAVHGELTQPLDSELGHHYGISASLSSGDSVTLTTDSPPQVARHRGYDTAFLEMSAIDLTI